MPELKAGVYLHYSGLLVQVIGVARHSETNEKFVTYVPLGVKAGPRLTVRPYKAFFEVVDLDGKLSPRFKYLGEEVPPSLAKDYLPKSKV